VGKGDVLAAPILLAKMSKGQEIELICKAYKVSGDLSRADTEREGACCDQTIPYGPVTLQRHDTRIDS
jgi:hypothetical protein